jgi:hypothetical protein
VKALLVDLDDTLLDYSGGADRSWAEACAACCPPSGIDPAVLVTTLIETRRWFWDDPVRQRTERLNMVGAWQHIVEFALERLGRSAPGLAAAIARDYAVRRREAMSLFPEALGCPRRATPRRRADGDGDEWRRDASSATRSSDIAWPLTSTRS